MRLLHPTTLETISSNKEVDFRKATSSKKQVISHAWSEVIKFKVTNQKHPKMFIYNDYGLGVYMQMVKQYGDMTGCKFNSDLLKKYPNLYEGFLSKDGFDMLDNWFDDLYLFSDCISLYYKGINILPFIYGDDWRKLIPVESLKEISRQINKTLDKQ